MTADDPTALERIATAMERIAAALDPPAAKVTLLPPCERCGGEGWVGNQAVRCKACQEVGRVR